ncbi:FAD-dependent oxidoreductase [Pantoea sp. BAV 3049]|uniref:FAD-dependent oxidoreductase n=1 Tax=Pantoea sp. BAV 3049 TaxID=2654188 RepID=UPI00131D1429|nr:FAD-dependent oxidoreductase [Pantoea sp. BAV 3049]
MNRFVVVNPGECIGCHVCEVACVLAHNQQAWPASPEQFRPRIHLITRGGSAVPLTCRHCNNAPCVASCPTEALVPEGDSIRLREEKCIGCKNCLLACPFGAIEQVSDRPVVQKCDLCQQLAAGQAACVETCPAQALQLMDEAELQRLRLYRQHATAGGKNRPAPIASKGVELLDRTPRIGAAKLAAKDRKLHFREIYQGLNQAQARYETDRCLYCAQKAWCNWTCPLHNAIPDFIQLAAAGKLIEAAELSHQTSSLPEICGRVCPQDRLCEGACTLNGQPGSVSIGNIERYITDEALARGWRPVLHGVKDRPERVAIVGAGPAGLGCADVLRRQGVHVDVYDRHPEIGGLLTFGIPSFKLDKQVIVNRHSIFSEMGINFHLNCEIGRDIPFSRLLEEYDAVFLGVGTYGLMGAGLENEDAPGVMQALPYLIANTRQVMELEEDEQQPYVSLKGKKVVVLGGGDTAMDCLRTAVRQQAESVICAYRRDEKSMPGSKKEVTNAREEGVEFMFNLQPQYIGLDEAGCLNGIGLIRTEMGAPGSDGRRRPQPIAGSEFVLAADALILAFGFQAHEMPWLAGQGIRFDRWGLIITGQSGRKTQTHNPKVFAAGDAVHGADLVVTAMAEGRRSAGEMMQMFEEQQQLRERAS